MSNIQREEVQLTISTLIKDLSEGLTWLQKEDMGFGSIQAKYGIPEKEVLVIQKHPKLKEVPTRVKTVKLVDDLDGQPLPSSEAPAPEVTVLGNATLTESAAQVPQEEVQGTNAFLSL